MKNVTDPETVHERYRLEGQGAAFKMSSFCAIKNASFESTRQRRGAKNIHDVVSRVFFM